MDWGRCFDIEEYVGVNINNFFVFLMDHIKNEPTKSKNPPKKFKNSPMVCLSPVEVLPALDEILATSAITLSVLSGAKSKTKHSFFIRPFIDAGV
jgi:hypothetical protein